MSEGLLYFLLATVVALVVPAAEQRGWTLRRWIYGGVALVCLLAIPLWGPIGKYFPGAAVFVQKISDSPSAWFTLVMVLFIVSLAPFRKSGTQEVIRADAKDDSEIADLRAYVEARFVGIGKGMEAIWEKINSTLSRTGQNPISKAYEVEKWMRGDHAVKIFCPDLEAQIKPLLQRNREYREETDTLRKEIKNLSSAMIVKFGQNIDAEVLDQNAKTSRMNDLVKKSDDGHREIRNLYGWERQTLVGLLEEGKLVAQGFVAGRQANSPPIDIPKEEWRVLKFDQDDIFWERVTGPDIEYFGVRLGEPKGQISSSITPSISSTATVVNIPEA